MTEDYSALWRSSAYEAVPHTDDFPEALLVLPELFDGSIGQGKATKITVSINLINESTGILKVTDNGTGIGNERRLLHWAAQKATDNLHRNGHGTKKCLTKWHQEYSTANWSIHYRKQGKNLQHIKGPFKGPDTFTEEIENDEQTLMPHGTEISIHFNMDVLPSLSNATSLSAKLREIIQTRYSQEILARTEFIIDIQDTKKRLATSSHAKKWTSFKKAVEDAVEGGVVSVAYSNSINIVGGRYNMDIFHIDVSGSSSFALKKEFPLYGCKSMKSSRVHVSLAGRMVEAIPIYKLLDKEANHNDFNGWLGFVDFIPNTSEDFDKLPMPCTTKVSFYENDPVFKEFIKKFEKIFKPLMNSSPKPVAPVPKPVVPPPKPVVPPPKPAVPPPKPTVIKPNPVVVAPNPVVVAPNPVVVTPNLVVVAPNPVVVAPVTPFDDELPEVPEAPKPNILEVIRTAAQTEPPEIQIPSIEVTNTGNSLTIIMSHVDGRLTGDRVRSYINTNGAAAFYKLFIPTQNF
jgi:hypothetical protein